MNNIQMIDLQSQYKRLEKEINEAIRKVMNSGVFINGPQVETFCTNLAAYLQVPHVIPCANGTDAIRLALKALNTQPGDEVILPAFTYIAAAEMVASLGLTPILIDVDPDTFNMDPALLEQAISRATKAIIAVHLFGQTCHMEPILKIARKYKIGVIEDNAQSLGAEYTFADGSIKKAGTMAHIGTTSFFPTKPLACYGDGGAVITEDDKLAGRIRLLANHGQVKKYHHKIIGSNSRLDTIQAAILDVKLKYMDEFTAARQRVAERYNHALHTLNEICLPRKTSSSTHIYHQYTIQVKDGKRDELQAFLAEKNIPSTIYYPMPVQEQEAYKWVARSSGDLKVSVRLCKKVLSLPMHTEMTESEQDYIIEQIIDFFRKKENRDL
ncbi:MAG: DegT/DnrJ/EryC1/StrS family aminotransferase [Tannerella sp.]|jgi:dTDP-4-amino-4,6-dideoxygalactose transaminase|nr:DegT/DnrJ/EryC1/StrS family aminotransferase [Tannerella sp.]